MKLSKSAQWSLGYLGIFCGLWLLHVLLLSERSPQGGLIGVIAFLYTLPLSLLTTPIADALQYIEWTDAFLPSNYKAYAFFYGLGLLPSAIVNTIGIYFIHRYATTNNPKTGE